MEEPTTLSNSNVPQIKPRPSTNSPLSLSLSLSLSLLSHSIKPNLPSHYFEQCSTNKQSQLIKQKQKRRGPKKKKKKKKERERKFPKQKQKKSFTPTRLYISKDNFVLFFISIFGLSRPRRQELIINKVSQREREREREGEKQKDGFFDSCFFSSSIKAKSQIFTFSWSSS